MTKRQESVLITLMSGGMFGITASEISYTANAPEPSVRRAIQELIRLGHNISFANDGLYYYRTGY